MMGEQNWDSYLERKVTKKTLKEQQCFQSSNEIYTTL